MGYLIYAVKEYGIRNIYIYIYMIWDLLIIACVFEKRNKEYYDDMNNMYKWYSMWEHYGYIYVWRDKRQMIGYMYENNLKKGIRMIMYVRMQDEYLKCTC